MEAELMHALAKRVVLFLFFLPAVAVLADEPIAYPSQFELGVSVGTPGVANIQFGYWGNTVPIVARGYGGFIGIAGGAGGEIGWLFDNEGPFRQYVAAGFEAGSGFDPFSGFSGSWVGAGPHYGFNWNGFSLDAGVSIGTGSRAWLMFGMPDYTGPLPVLNVGYSVFF